MNKEKYGDPGSPTASPLRKKLTQFWEYYKWHTLISLAVLAAVILIIVQSCSRPTYDFRLLYAGPHTVGSLENKNIVTSVALASGKDAEAELTTYYINLEQGSGSGGYTGQNLEAFDHEVQNGVCLVYFLSPDLYNRLIECNGGLVNLSSYLPETLPNDIRFYDDTEYGVYLSSLPIVSLPGLSSLPSDTLLCLRSPVSLVNVFNPKQAEEEHKSYQALITSLISYVPEN